MMAVMGGEPFDEFERWFTATGWNHDDERVRAWFRAFFGRWGPVSADVVEVGWQLDQLASTGRAVDVVLGPGDHSVAEIGELPVDPRST